MTSAAMSAEQPRRFNVAGRSDMTAAATDTRARTRGRTHLSAVPAGATVAAPPARPVRGVADPLVVPRTAQAKTAARAAKPRRALARPTLSAAPLRRAVRVVYTDGVDGWIVRTSAPSIAEVFNFEYAVPGDWKPFRIWCKVWTRTAGVVFAGTLDGLKWFLIHPVRGPLTIAGGAAAVITPHLIH